MLITFSTFTGSRVKKMRLENNWTQKDLANRLGLKNDTAIANYESGYSIPKDEIKFKMCELFNCSIDYLVGFSYYRTNLEFKIATEETVAFLKTSNTNTKELINSILNKPDFLKGPYNFDNLEKLIDNDLSKYRSIF